MLTAARENRVRADPRDPLVRPGKQACAVTVADPVNEDLLVTRDSRDLQDLEDRLA